MTALSAATGGAPRAATGSAPRAALPLAGPVAAGTGGLLRRGRPGRRRRRGRRGSGRPRGGRLAVTAGGGAHLALGAGLAEAVGPALHVDLLDPRERERRARHVLGHGGAGGDVGVAPDRHRRDELGVRADERARLDGGAVLAEAVVVAGDGAGADVGAGADRHVAQVGEVVRLG